MSSTAAALCATHTASRRLICVAARPPRRAGTILLDAAAAAAAATTAAVDDDATATLGRVRVAFHRLPPPASTHALHRARDAVASNGHLAEVGARMGLEALVLLPPGARTAGARSGSSELPQRVCGVACVSARARARIYF